MRRGNAEKVDFECCTTVFFPFNMASEKLFKTMRQVVTSAHLVKGLWLQYHVAGFCCR